MITLGIDISINKAVSFNPNHDHRVITAIDKNPKISMIGTYPRITVFSIYQRTKLGDRNRDGNPLMYALKEISGYRIDLKELFKFKPSFIAILNTIKMSIHNTDISFVVMPSSSHVSQHFGRKVARSFHLAPHNNCFIKRTVKEVLVHFEHTENNIKPQHNKALKRTLSDLQSLPEHTLFTMKKIPNKLRRYFSPWKLNPIFNFIEIKGKNIILIDDLLSTGTTLVSAAKELSQIGLTCKTAICLLSNL